MKIIASIFILISLVLFIFGWYSALQVDDQRIDDHTRISRLEKRVEALEHK